jgi:lysophospholipase L1-like esterase
MRTLLLLAVLIFHCDDLQNLYPSSDTIIEGQLDWQKQFYFDRINEFKNEPIGKNKIVFLGNSIVKGGGNWNEKYELNNIVNRGISGDYTKGVLKRLDEILFYKPISVFLMIGINEFFADNSENAKINPKYVAKNILKIADIISEHSPKTKVFIHTILPINNDQYIRVKEVNYNFLHSNYTPSINSQVEETNSILKSNRQYQVIDLHSIFIDKTFKLNPNLSSDGVHLNENGYNLWVQETMGLMKTLQNN